MSKSSCIWMGIWSKVSAHSSSGLHLSSLWYISTLLLTLAITLEPILLKRINALSPSLGVRKLKLLNKGLILMLISSIRKKLLLKLLLRPLIKLT